MPSYCRRRRENEHVSAVGVGVTANYGVRLLLEAEQKATQKVENARKKRKEKLRRARHEAKIEVDLLKQRRQSTYQQLLDEVSAEQKALEQQIAKETEEKLKSINEMVCNNRNTALRMLVDEFLRIVPRAHPNFCLRKEIVSCHKRPKHSNPPQNAASVAPSSADEPSDCHLA